MDAPPLAVILAYVVLSSSVGVYNFVKVLGVLRTLLFKSGYKHSHALIMVLTAGAFYFLDKHPEAVFAHDLAARLGRSF